MHYEFNDLVFYMTGTKNKYIAKVPLYPGDSVRIEADWFMYGPAMLTVWHERDTGRISLLQKPLPKDLFDLDNPLEYPCLACGAERFVACLGDNEECTYRVFHSLGGKL